MKVKFVAPYTLPLAGGGFESQVYHIFEELKKLDVDVSWHQLDKCDYDDVDILQVMHAEGSMLHLIEMVKKKGCKVVLTPMQGSRVYSNKYLKSAQIVSRIPQLFTPHKELKEVIQSADYLIPLSSFEAERMVSVFGAERNKMTVIPNGLSEPFLDHKNEIVDIPLSNYLLTVGRIEQNKNQLTLIKVAKAMGLSLIIVGQEGTNGSDYYESCRRESLDNVLFWGAEKNQYVLKALYQKAAVTVIPSYSEMVPLVAFESLSQKTPVVCTDRCGIAGDDIPGLFFSSVDTKSLIQSIKIAFSFDRNRITDKGIYTWEDIAIMYKNVYTSLL